MKKIIAVVGDAIIEEGGDKFNLAFNLGKALIDAGYRIQTGGGGGVMEAVCMGAKTSKNYQTGDTIAILPSFDRSLANSYSDIVIPTGIDLMRNAIVANADASIAIGGGSGTLSEIAFAWHFCKLIIAYDNVQGWSAKLAGTRVDDRVRYLNINKEEDIVFAVQDENAAVKILKEKIGLYDHAYIGISEKNRFHKDYIKNGR
jgi:hypothetical protein